MNKSFLSFKACFCACSDSNIDGITGFNEEDSKVVFNHMNHALRLAISSNRQVMTLIPHEIAD